MNPYRDKIISALVGLAGACGGNSKTERTDAVIIGALAAAGSCDNDELRAEGAAEGAAESAIRAVRDEKNAVAPGCAFCASPCGNTSDYDMRRLYEAEHVVRDAKLRLIGSICSAAARITRAKADKNGGGYGRYDKNGDFFCAALSFIGYDVDADALLRLADEADDIGSKQTRS